MKKAKRALAILLSAGMMISSINVPSFATELGNAKGTSESNIVKVTKPVTEAFVDIKEGAWYEDAVQYVYDNGLMSGSNGSFKPNKAVTRAMVVVILYGLEGSPEIADDTACEVFGDVERGKWYTDAICWAYSNGIASGNTRTLQFNAENPVTREQLATFIYRYAEYKDFDTTQVGDLSELLNVGKMNQYAREAVVWAVGAGLISGVKLMDDMGNISYDLAPQASASRAQMASILMRFCESYDITMSEDGVKNTTTNIPDIFSESYDITMSEDGVKNITTNIPNLATSNPTIGNVSSTPRYFPVTMFNYDKAGMNQITRQMEVEKHISNLNALDEWDGFYFMGEGDSGVGVSYDYSEYINQKVAYEKVTGTTVEAGASYVLVSGFVDTLGGGGNHYYGVSGADEAGERLNPTKDSNRTNVQIGISKSTLSEAEIYDAKVWTCDEQHRLYYVENGKEYYLDIVSCKGSSCEGGVHSAGVTEDKNTAAILESSATDGIFFVHDTCHTSDYYLNIVDNAEDDQFGAWNVNDAGSKFHLYKKVEGPNLEDPRMNLLHQYRKVTDSTLDTNATYIIGSNVSNKTYSLGGENDGKNRLKGVQILTNPIHESVLSDETVFWKVDSEDYVYCTIDETPYYINVKSCGNASGCSGGEHAVELTTTKEGSVKVDPVSNEAGVFCLADTCGTRSYYLNLFGSQDRLFGAWTDGASDSNSKFCFYKQEKTTETAPLKMADYNNWLGEVPWNPEEIDNPQGGNLPAVEGLPNAPERNKKGNRLFNNLVQNELDAEGNIQFNVIEPGVFTLEEHDAKQVYTNVEMPFLYDSATGWYSFDSSKMSAWFPEGTGADNATMEYSASPQTGGGSYADGSKTMWMPYNATSNLSGVTKDYHFGMSFNIPFFATANGALPGTDATLERNQIAFDFSGDDDVWVFIDGILVLDLGGIHNNLHGKMNFATNTWEVTRDSTTNAIDQAVSYVDGAATSGKIFATAENTNDGLIPMTREAFAETAVHTMTVFYLERGAGSSNNKMSFNLLIRDSVNVMKEVSSVDSENRALSDELMAYVNQRDFKMQLTNNGAPVANQNYHLMDIRGMYLQTLQTNDKGEFTLKNGQTAKFSGRIAPGSNYIVKELEDPDTTAWAEPEWYSIARLTDEVLITTDGVTTTDPKVIETEKDTAAADDRWACATVEVPGTANREKGTSYDAYMEMINIRCKNTLDLSGEPEINDDKVVIDYGIPVEIDMFANDIVPDNVFIDYENVALNRVGEESFGTYVYDSAAKKVTYTLTKQLTASEKIEYTVPYTDGDGNQGTGKATIWIMPATSMYYEEDFDFVTYTGAWSDLDDDANVFQEPGVVGTVGDSPYGSDVSYLDDAEDSNGTSKYVQTDANNGAGFTYTFTGKGTTFFARTTNNSGYMKVDIECVNSDQTTTYVDQWRRDTSYKTDNSDTTLYNIPVFSWTAEEYGTYKVTVSLAKLVTSPKTGKQLYGTEFWLDGIKIFEPLDESSADAAEVRSAYAADGEANVDVVTLRNKIIHNQMVYDEATQSYIWSEQDQKNNRFVVFTDSIGEIKTAEEYISKGPKEEVYLQDGQSVSFALEEWDPNGAHVFLGIKAPMGAGTVLINGVEVSINNSVDGYYEISDYRDLVNGDAKFVITAGADSLISLTTIKVTGGTKFTIISGLNQEEENTVHNVDIDVAGYEGGDALPGTGNEV